MKKKESILFLLQLQVKYPDTLGSLTSIGQLEKENLNSN